MQDEVEKNHRVPFESLEILIRQSYFIHCLEF